MWVRRLLREKVEAVCYVWCSPLKILLATAPQGAMGFPCWSFAKGMQYGLGFWGQETRTIQKLRKVITQSKCNQVPYLKLLREFFVDSSGPCGQNQYKHLRFQWYRSICGHARSITVKWWWWNKCCAVPPDYRAASSLRLWDSIHPQHG